jgi:hypothetical protein
MGRANLLTIVPLDEVVWLDVEYIVFTGDIPVITRSPLRRTMTLAQANRYAVGSVRTGARARITARGITCRDPELFRCIWARRGFFQQSQ